MNFRLQLADGTVTVIVSDYFHVNNVGDVYFSDHGEIDGKFGFIQVAAFAKGTWLNVEKGFEKTTHQKDSWLK